MFRKSRVIVIVAGAALAAGAAGVIASQASQPQGRGHGSPLALRQGPPPTLNTKGWANVAEARASIDAQQPESKAELGLTPAAIAATRSIYTFPATTPVFGGISIYEVPRPGRGSCIYLLDSAGCSANAAAIDKPGEALPVQVGVTDFDGPTGAIPIVLAGEVAAQVKAVTMTCFGTTYKATIAGRVVAWVATTADIGAADCVLRATLTNGRVFSEQL
jgi:hypothetical protein